MADLDPFDVMRGKIVPQPGDMVGGQSYAGGDPTDSGSYRSSGTLDLTGLSPQLLMAMVRPTGQASGSAQSAPAPQAPPASMIGSPYMQNVNDQLQKSLLDNDAAQFNNANSTVPLVNGRRPPGGKFDVINLHGIETDPTFTPQVADALTAAIRQMNAEGITPAITNGFRGAAEQQGDRDRPGPGGAAKEASWHQAGMAVDMNSRDKNFARIVDIMRANNFTWGGTFSQSDRVHFQYAPKGKNPSAQQMDAVGGR